MLLATIICSDPGCTEEHEIAVDRLVQLDGFTCECGYGFVLTSVAELAEPGDAHPGSVVSIATRRRGAAAKVGRRAA